VGVRGLCSMGALTPRAHRALHCTALHCTALHRVAFIGSATMVKLSRRLDQLVQRREELARKLEVAEFKMVRTGQRPLGRVRCCRGKKGDLVQLLEEELMDVNASIKHERRRESQIKVSTSGFVCFRNMRTVALAHQVALVSNNLQVT